MFIKQKPVDNLQLIVSDHFGMGCTQSSYMIPPNIPMQQINRLILISNVNHQFNVNTKYQYLTKIDESKTVGEGLKKTFAFKCLTTQQQLIAKRKQFWETRSGGQKECWKALQNVVKSKSNNQAQKLLTKAKIIPLNGSIQMCIDNRGNKYQLPVFVINNPMSYEEERIAEKHLINNYEKYDLKLTIRSVKFPNEDIILDVSTQTSIKQIKAAIIKKKGLNKCSMRLFYSGKELLDDKAIGNYGYIDQTIIQAMIK